MDKEILKTTYKGVNIYRNCRTGMYVSYSPLLRADTLRGIKQLITSKVKQ